MLDIQLQNSVSAVRADETCDLCIFGAGIAGLNALFAAAEYLSKGDRVILIDEHSRCGGMWNTSYDFVRVHQPHAMFTVGDIAWDWEKPKWYLATGTEVQAHLAYCRDVIGRKVDLVERYGCCVEAVEEVVSAKGTAARIEYRPLSGHGAVRTVVAKRLINATALNVPTPPPLELSSDDVVSTNPHQLRQSGVHESSAPAYVVGGGKTGMDTVLELLQHRPDRAVTLINGQGTVFANRDLFLPAGARRWWSGRLLLKTFGDLAMRFDGRNEDDVFGYFRETYTISPDGTGEQFFFGLLSEAENAAVAGGLTGIVKGYLQDVENGPGGPQMVLRDGKRLSVEPGSVFINCTGHLLRNDLPDCQCLSPHGTTLSISARAAVHFQPSVAAYFLTHLFFRESLRGSPIYEIDLASIFTQNRKAWNMTAFTQSFMNAILLLDELPFGVVNRCGLDLDRWYPLPRRMAGLIDVKFNRGRYLDHCRKSLDWVGCTYGVRCGPIS